MRSARRHPPGRAAVLHSLGPERREALAALHPDLGRLAHPERQALYLRHYPDPFDTLAPALRAEGWVVVDVVLDDPVLEGTDGLRRWLLRFGPQLVLASEPATGLWSPRAAAFMGRRDVGLRTGVLVLGPEAPAGPVSLARYAAFGRARVVCLEPGASEAAGRAAAATGAVVVGPTTLGAPWPTFANGAEARALVQRALSDDAQARAWVAATRGHLREERHEAVASLIASIPPRTAPRLSLG